MQFVTSFFMKMPFERWCGFTGNLMIERMNSDSANILGNLANRTTYVHKYFKGIVEDSVVGDYDDDLKAVAISTRDKVAGEDNNLQKVDAHRDLLTHSAAKLLHR